MNFLRTGNFLFFRKMEKINQLVYAFLHTIRKPSYLSIQIYSELTSWEF